MVYDAFTFSYCVFVIDPDFSVSHLDSVGVVSAAAAA